MGHANTQLSAREAALKILGVYRRQKAWSDLAINSVIKRSSLSAVDISLTVQMVYGVLQNMTLCDFYISHYSSIELKKLEPRVLDILRLSIFQIVFLTKIPHTAAVNEGVILAKKFSNQRAAGFVNALLRKASKAVIDGTLPEITGDNVHRLSLRFSHPQWLVKQFCEVLGEADTEALLMQNNNDKVPTTIQVNTILTDTSELLSLLKSEGIDAKCHPWLKDCIEVVGAGNITRLESYLKGYFYIQDAAARLSVVAAGPRKGDFVLDGCAAPGGKSFASAIMMENSGHILACDVHAAKLRHIESGSTRMGIGIIDTMEMDASKKIMASKGSAKDSEKETMADIVLADVPCSGFGIIRKKPEIRFKTKQDIAGLPQLQLNILSTLSSYVKPDGVLLYSTCTLLRCENEDVIGSFLNQNKNFIIEGFSLPGVGEIKEGMTTLWPHLNGTDGFFICKMRKIGDN